MQQARMPADRRPLKRNGAGIRIERSGSFRADRARAFHVVPHFLFAGSKKRTTLVELLGADSLRVRMGRNGLEGGAERRLVDALQQDSNGIGSADSAGVSGAGGGFRSAHPDTRHNRHTPMRAPIHTKPATGTAFPNKQGRAGHQMRHDTAGKTGQERIQ